MPFAFDPRSDHWPAELEQVRPVPAELWARGRLELLARRPRLAIVGSRSPTPYGLTQAERFARGMVEAGLVVVSGLARGIDQAAHRSALDAGGATIAVLGSGVDRPWPHGPFTDRMLREGLLLSEYAPGQPPRRHHFPLRNRLIAGLCQAVLVVEAARASGSLITARWATEQGRHVFAIPGRVDHPMARGAHQLVRDGASLVESPGELLAELGLFAPEPPADVHTTGPREPLVELLTGETRSAEELAGVSGLELPRVLARLAELELDGRVVRSPGGLWRLPG